MRQRPRIYYSETDKALMWDRWQKGDSLHKIADLFNRNHSSIAGILSRTGGIRPPQRKRSRLALTLSEREEISRSVVAGDSIRSIARTLGRAASTVVMVVSDVIEPLKPIKPPGIGHIVPSDVNWWIIVH